MAISGLGFLTVVAGIFVVFAGGSLAVFGLFQSAIGRPLVDLISLYAIVAGLITIGIWMVRSATRK
jgi:hypothetical protein